MARCLLFLRNPIGESHYLIVLVEQIPYPRPQASERRLNQGSNVCVFLERPRVV